MRGGRTTAYTKNLSYKGQVKFGGGAKYISITYNKIGLPVLSQTVRTGIWSEDRKN